ncbi:DNA/RNA non-specific endonuclease [Mesorhizobium sp. Cs1299R1N1]|uniref:DNA/RNA non-specific endonuclease n=1 Tax=Mesorhizobium sp. Cs1299R1N1 TaxID=3015172 RepID=UPI00301BC803
MATPAEKAAQLRAFNDSLLDDDPEMADAEGTANERLEVNRPPQQAIELESIVMRRRRPVLAIQNGAAVLEFKDEADLPLWKSRLESAATVLGRAIPCVGRIELTGNPDFSWVGTGWLVDPRYLVTNRHVAEEFARSEGDAFVMQSGPDGEMAASIDMLQEIGRNDKQVFQVKGVSYIEPRPGLDLAFLEVEQIDGTVAKPIRLSVAAPTKNPFVATIGYPAFDSRIPEPDLMKQIYGEIFDKKRLAPGAITEVDQDRVLHNCTTLGGNSGSVVVDLKSGEALGLHFSGSFLRTNFAVRADRVRERLDALLAGTLRGKREVPARPRPSRRSASMTSVATGTPAVASRVSGNATSITIPLTVTVSLGGAGQPANVSARPRTLSSSARQHDGDDTDNLVETEAKAKPEDYNDRKGYVATFLGDEFAVELPTIVKGKSDILTWGSGRDVLPYEHFSVVMNAKRRQCFFSACNIDGQRSKSSKRTAWRFDPRIPLEMQIMKECYGSTPKFSRGHMSRREDPAWGETAEVIQRGADDSMHVTNVTPQMQSFNAPIWLALEDYALQHAREDDQRISVFTGPYFNKNDPTMFGVRIPVKFWKVIAFVHDETHELCATGYEMSQEDNLEPPEFVFGDFVSPQLNISTQVPISTIEARAGISFDGLVDIDPLSSEGVGQPTGPLLFPEQIRFI